MPEGAEHPFVRYRRRLDSYRGVGDEEFVDLVGRLDEAVCAVDGRGMSITPVVRHGDHHAKVEVDQVGGSHKSRHLFGTALHLLTAPSLPDRLKISSCGNAALAASVIARALDRPLDVFVPEWADAAVVARIDELGGTVHRCPRREGEAGDPAYLRFVEADGFPFSVTGVDTPTTFDGGRTLGWELADQVPDLDVVYVQVGGGALATSVARALAEVRPEVRVMPVQAEGCAPLATTWAGAAPDFDWDTAVMAPWPDPQSAATGILDDVTHDWRPLLEATLASGGHPVVAPERTIVDAHHRVDLPVSATGTAGLAGLLTEPPAADETAAVLFTGVQW